MKILFIATKYDYGNPHRGLSYEYYNFWDTLKKMDNEKHVVEYFPYDEIILKHGKEKMNKMLVEVVKKERPDLCFFLFSYEISKETLKEIKKIGAVTFNWFTDDIWRFDSFSKYYAWLFDYISTTDSIAFRRYRDMGYRNAIKTQFGCNHFLYRPMKDSRGNKVSFIGQKYGDRGKIIESIATDGTPVECWGSGWKNGRISQEKMIEIFSNSKININFSASSPSSKVTLKDIGAIFLRKEMDKKIRFYNPREWMPRALLRIKKQKRKQIKGRTFEISGCGGFQLCEYAEGIEDYYVLDKEISTFHNTKELREKIEWYLKNESARKKVANSSYKRTIRDHTYEKRFNDIFKEMGL